MGRLGENEEATAGAVEALLNTTGLRARALGAGVHWQVEAEAGARAVVVHCFWYERVVSGLMLGMNAGNARQRPRGRPPAYEGPEYLVILRHGEVEVADGRTRAEAAAVAAVRRWLDGATLEQVAREQPFVDRTPRAMRALAAQLSPGLRWDVEAEPGGALWVYGRDRSCVATLDGGAISLSCLVGQARVAHGEAIADVPAAVAAWLVEYVPVTQLALRVPGIELEAHVELIEQEPARWHWLHVRDRVSDPGDVLTPSRALIEALAASPIASSFYTYSSLFWFCFSASSHYPWVDAGLPRVVTLPSGQCTVDDVPYDCATAVERVEQTLAAYPIRPFFGSAAQHELPELAACLRTHGSALAPALIQRGAWYELEVARGERRCEVSRRHVHFVAGAHDGRESYSSLDEAVRAIRRFLEDEAPLEEIAPR